MATAADATTAAALAASAAARVPLAGYASRLSVRPGEAIEFHVSNATGSEQVAARVVKVICADANPAGPGVMLEEDFEGSAVGALAVLQQPGSYAVPRGSYARIPALEGHLADGHFTLCGSVYPTALAAAPWQAIASLSCGGSPGGQLQRQLTLGVTSSGCLEARTAGGIVVARLLSTRLQERHWYRIHLSSADAETGSPGVFIAVTPLSRDVHSEASRHSCFATPEAHLDWSRCSELTLAAELCQPESEGDAVGSHFNGKLEGFSLYDVALDTTQAMQETRGETPAPDHLVSSWDFALRVSTQEVVDVGVHGLHGHLVNTPARGMTGSKWSGEEMCFRHRPHEYGAITFHQDDLDDCKWPPSFRWHVPPGTPSAVYALLLTAGAAEENIPFHVVPPRGKATAPLAVLVSTFTYTVYGDNPNYSFSPSLTLLIPQPQRLSRNRWLPIWRQAMFAHDCRVHRRVQGQS